ncbi:MAG TPA: hypothetical protein ENH23_00860 [candidate division Zixibacteria bacterium]|nr:hypothetical protein [candidate division Zixibacteria bacterium]
MKQKQSFITCNNFDKKSECPQYDHEYMKEALRIHEGSNVNYQDGEKAFKADELCAVCDKFIPF